MTYAELKAALAALGLPIAEDAWDRRPATDYLEIQIDGQGDSMEGDNATNEQAIEGSVDLFSYTKRRTNYDAVWAVLRSSGCAVRFSSKQYESETRLTHYEWIFQLPYLEEDPAEPATTEGGGGLAENEAAGA